MVFNRSGCGIKIFAGGNLAPIDGNEFRFELLGLAGGELGEQIPPTGRHKRHPLPFPFHNQADGHALHTPSGKLRPHLPPQKLGNFVAEQAVENSASFLGPDQVFVNCAGIRQGLVNRFVRDFVEHQPMDRNLGTQHFD